jgi:uncharacterized protein (TIGR03086 family)
LSENTRRYLAAVCGLDHVIRSVPADKWGNPSPCEGWTARDVAGHAMSVVNNVASGGGVGTRVDPFTNPGDFAGDDPAVTWRGVRARLFEALDTPGFTENRIAGAAGEMSLDAYVAMVMGDALIHSWDVARATGGDEVLDPELVPIALASLQARDVSILRAPLRYADEVVTPSDADLQTQLLAFAGRQL